MEIFFEAVYGFSDSFFIPEGATLLDYYINWNTLYFSYLLDGKKYSSSIDLDFWELPKRPDELVLYPIKDGKPDFENPLT